MREFIHGAGLYGAEDRFDFAPQHVRRIGWQEAHGGAGLCDQLEGVLVLLGPEVVRDDDRHQNTLGQCDALASKRPRRARPRMPVRLVFAA